MYRIFYAVNRKGDRRLSLRELKRSDLVEAMLQVDAEEDINKILRYFSYEHFYVIYCKFWELDTVSVCSARPEGETRVACEWGRAGESQEHLELSGPCAHLPELGTDLVTALAALDVY